MARKPRLTMRVELSPQMKAVLDSLMTDKDREAAEKYRARKRRGWNKPKEATDGERD